MPFDPSIRRTDNATLDQIWFALARKAASSGVAIPSNVWLVDDDETAPTKQPTKPVFVTIKVPPLIWEHGNVMAGGGVLSKLMVQGQCRITIWIESNLDTYGSIEKASQKAAGAQRGTSLVDQMMDAFWEQDLVDDVSGVALTNKPMEFVSFDPPPSGSGQVGGWRPWRLVYSVCFNWSRREAKRQQ